jgi:hypothetical protein
MSNKFGKKCKKCHSLLSECSYCKANGKQCKHCRNSGYVCDTGGKHGQFWFN